MLEHGTKCGPGVLETQPSPNVQENRLRPVRGAWYRPAGVEMRCLGRLKLPASAGGWQWPKILGNDKTAQGAACFSCRGET